MKRKWKRLLGLTLAAVLATGTLAGCGNQETVSQDAETAETSSGEETETTAPEETETTEPEDTTDTAESDDAAEPTEAGGSEEISIEGLNTDITVAYVTSALTTQIFRDQVTALEEYCEEIGVEFVYTAEEDVGKQLTACENYISMGVDCLMVHTNKDTFDDVMKLCQEAGIPWFSYDEKIEGDDAFYGWNNYDLGYAIGTNAANWVNENFGEGDTVYAASNNYPSASFLVTREQGYIDAVNELSKATIEWVADAEGGTTDKGVTAGENFLQCGYELNLICAINDSGLCGVYEAYKAAGKANDEKLGFFGCDSDPEALAAIKEGGIYKGTINTGLIKLAPDFINIAVRLANGVEEGDHWGDFILITEDNVDDWM